jgi:hypothetical protein
MSEFLQRLGVDVGQPASIYFFLFALYRLGRYFYIRLYDTVLCIGSLRVSDTAEKRQAHTLLRTSRLTIKLFSTHTLLERVV